MHTTSNYVDLTVVLSAQMFPQAITIADGSSADDT
jgi:hypothetical protein